MVKKKVTKAKEQKEETQFSIFTITVIDSEYYRSLYILSLILNILFVTSIILLSIR